MKSLHPQGMYTLCGIELIERVSYCGIQSLLVLYLANAFALPQSQVYAIYGAFVGLTFIVSIGAGIVADRILGLPRAVKLGGIAILLGNLVLAFSSPHTVYLGLSLIVIGTGLFKPNCAGLVGLLYNAQDRRRDAGYTLYYMWTNIGGLIGPLIYGVAAQAYSWEYAFIISAIGMLIGLGIYQYNKKPFTSLLIEKNNYSLIGTVYVFSPAVVLLLWQLFLHPQWVGNLFNGAAVLTALAFLGYLIFNSNHQRFKTLLMATLILISLGYFALVFQTSTSLTLLIQDFVDRKVGSWDIPAATFAALEPLFVALGASVVTHFWLRFEKQHYGFLTFTKVVSGLFLGGFGFLVLALMASWLPVLSTTHYPLFMIVFGNLLIGFGELCIASAVLSFIAHLTPEKFRGTMMGVYYLALAFSGYLAGLIAKTTHAVSIQGKIGVSSTYAYFSTYVTLAILAVSVGLILWLIAYRIKSYPT